MNTPDTTSNSRHKWGGEAKKEREQQTLHQNQLHWVDSWGWIVQLRPSKGNLEYSIPFHCHNLQLSGQLCWVDSWGGVLFCPIQTMVIHIYVWPRITHIYYICRCQEYPSYFHCFTRHKQALGVLLILAPTSQQISLRCDISEGMLHAFKLLDVCLLHAL